MRIQRHVLFVVAVCALLGGWVESAEFAQAADEKPVRLETLDEYLVEYNAKRAEVNAKPNVVAAVERAFKLLPREFFSDEALKEGWALSREMRVLEKKAGRFEPLMPDTGPVARPKAGVPALYRKQVMANEAALVEIRKARGLPFGMALLDWENNLAGANAFAKHGRAVTRMLDHCLLVDLAEQRPAAAREQWRDMLTVERALAQSPRIMGELSRDLVATYFSDINCMRVAVSGSWAAKQLDEMAEELEALDRPPTVVLRHVLRFERVYVLAEFDKFSTYSDEKLEKVITDTLRPGPVLSAFLGDKAEKREKIVLRDVRAKLPSDRKAIIAGFREIEEALGKPGARLQDKVPLLTMFSGPKGVGVVGRICGPWYWGTVHRRVAEACARRRAAVTLLRALAFRARKGRLPRAGELKMPEDPFRPGKRMTYVHDKKNGRIGVYAIGWEEELPQWMKDKLGAEKVKDPKVGQWLLLEGDKGAGTGD